MNDDKRRGPPRKAFGKPRGPSKFKGKGSFDRDRPAHDRAARGRAEREGEQRSQRYEGRRDQQRAQGPRKGRREFSGDEGSLGERQERPRWGKHGRSTDAGARGGSAGREEQGFGGQRGRRGLRPSDREFSRSPRRDHAAFDERPAQREAPDRGGRKQRSEDLRGRGRPHDRERDHPRNPKQGERPPRDRSVHNAGPHEASARQERDANRDGALWVYGRHAALAAITNPQRPVKRILAADAAMEWLSGVPENRRALIVKAAPFEIERALHEGAVHQGLAVEVKPLPRARLRETCAVDETHRPVVVLDQITDPHNIGAIFRSAAAFGAKAVIVQDRRTPPLAGALAKAAAGAVDIVPSIEVVNIARALEGLKELGYFCAGLAGEGGAPISEIPRDRPIALVLGAEGAGLRRLVAATCDGLFRIPLTPAMDSLNVSNAAAVALYACAPMERTLAE